MIQPAPEDRRERLAAIRREHERLRGEIHEVRGFETVEELLAAIDVMESQLAELETRLEREAAGR